jgi:hypothetical protein
MEIKIKSEKIKHVTVGAEKYTLSSSPLKLYEYFTYDIDDAIIFYHYNNKIYLRLQFLRLYNNICHLKLLTYSLLMYSLKTYDFIRTPYSYISLFSGQELIIIKSLKLFDNISMYKDISINPQQSFKRKELRL